MFNKLLRLIYPAQQPIDLARNYNIPHQMRFNFQTKNGTIIATSDDLPGFVTEAKDAKELFEMINDGILTYFDVPRRVGDIVHDHMTIDGYGTVSLGEQRQLA